MGMGEQQANGAKALLLNELHEALALARLVNAAVDDDGFTRLVPDDVGALLKQVRRDFINLDHDSKPLFLFSSHKSNHFCHIRRHYTPKIRH